MRPLSLVLPLSIAIATAACSRTDSRGAQVPGRSTVAAVASAADEAGREPADSAAPREQCRVRRITDGDTLHCTNGLKVRLIGIDAPELRQKPFGAESRAALASLLPVNVPVELERDVTPTDRYQRRLAHVWLKGMLVNEMMVRQGWAVLYTVPPNVKYVARLERAQKGARQARVGLWAQGGFDCLPRDARRGTC